MAKKRVVRSPRTKNASQLRVPWMVLVVLVVLLLGIFLTTNHKSQSTQQDSPAMAFDFANHDLSLNDQQLNFVNGSYMNSDQANGVHSAAVTYRSVNSAGNRAAAVISDSPGGSGTFYYVIGSMQKDGKEIYSKPVLLGDRIKIVSVTVDDPGEHDNGLVTVEYLDRGAAEAMAAEPTIQLTKKFSFEDNGTLLETLN